ncbi:MAG TPA: Hsp70 family protein [Actinoplanes sp.]|nr:Hsp70 family protein [Actinoplanes sp.]
MIPYEVGVDLGTTWTAAAVRIGDRVELARLGSRRAEIPSLVYAQTDGRLLVGDAAERRGAVDPAGLAREYKRRLGDPVPIMLRGVPYSAHQLTAAVLRHVLDTVAGWHGGPPTAVTVTRPANWGAYRLELLDEAVALAGAGPVRVRTEPEAAAVQHATARAIGEGETVAVYDLGGGTFDAAVLRRERAGFVLLGEPEGVEQLGGSDFDEAVLGHVLRVLGDGIGVLDPADPEAVAGMSRLRASCVEAKEALSYDTDVLIPVAMPGLHTRVRLSRDEFEAMIAPALQDTVAATRRAMSSAGVAPGDLSAILLAGGSTRIPLVEGLLAAAFGRPVVADPHPEHSIALGAVSAAPAVPAAHAPVAPAAADPASVVLVPGAGVSSSAAVTQSIPAVSAPGSASVSAQAEAPPVTATPVWGGQPPRRRRGLLTGVVVAALLAAGGATAVLLADDGDAGRTVTSGIANPAENVPEAAGARAGIGGPFPSDPILIRVDTGGDEPPERQSNIFVFTAGTRERRQLTTGGADVLPKWSHDGKRIAFVRLGDVNTVHVMNADGTGVRQIAEGSIYGRVTWSADDRRLAFVRKVRGVNQIFTVVPGAAPVQLTWSPFEKDDPEWTADGKGLTYWVRRGGGKQVFVLDLARPREPGRRIVGAEAGPVNDPVPSPDGKQLVYTRETGPDTSDIWIVGMDGRNPRQLIGHREREYNPTWSRDGQWIVFGRGELTRPTVVVARADGSYEANLTTDGAREGNPHWG